MNKNSLVTIRPYADTDKNFIYSTVLRGLYYGDSWFTLIDKDVFMHNYHNVLTNLLKSPNTLVKIACLIDDPEVILGYAIMNVKEDVLHYVFCKSAWRSIGIAKMLVPATIVTITHMTKVGLGLLKKYPNVKFNPFLI